MQEKRKSIPANKIIAILIVLLMLTGIVLFILNNNKTTITGTYPTNIKMKSSICVNDKALYPYTEKDDMPKDQGSSIHIIGTFNDNEQLEKIALTYAVYYTDSATAKFAEAHGHATFWTRLSDDGFDHTLFNNQFSVADKKVTLSFFASVDEIMGESYSYFLLPVNPNEGLSFKDFTENYESKGYKCETNE